MSENERNSIPQYTGLRSPALTLTCILTFIWSGLTVLGSIMIYGLYNDMPFLMEQGSFGEQEETVLKMLQSSSRSFFLIIAFLNALSFSGALIMWKLKKIGFHFYTTSQLLILAVPFFVISGYTVSLPNAIITIVFIAAYAVNLPQMR